MENLTIDILTCLSWSTGVCVSCVGGMGWPWSGGGLPECLGVPAVGLHPSGHCLYLALPNCHPPLPLYTLPSCLQGTQKLGPSSALCEE